jgi:ParB-like chromosome segregation protein Spo0J
MTTKRRVQSSQPKRAGGANGFPLSRDLTPRLVPAGSLKPLGRDVRKHSKAQIAKLAASLSEFGFVLPIVVDGTGKVVHGSALLLAATSLDLAEVPVVTIDDLPEAQIRALRLALNRIAEDSSWDSAELKIELTEILELDPAIDLEITGVDFR